MPVHNGICSDLTAAHRKACKSRSVKIPGAAAVVDVSSLHRAQEFAAVSGQIAAAVNREILAKLDTVWAKINAGGICAAPCLAVGTQISVFDRQTTNNAV